MRKRLLISNLIISTLILFVSIVIIVMLTKEVIPNTFKNNLNNIRISIIKADNKVLYDDWSNPESVDVNYTRKEVQDAFQDNFGFDTRPSPTENNEMMSNFAFKLSSDTVIRFSATQDQIHTFIEDTKFVTILGVLFILLICIVISSLLSTLFTRSLKRIDFRSLDDGDYNKFVKKFPELQEYVDRMNTQAKNWREFNAYISHEFQTPITLIRQYSNAVISKLDTSDKVSNTNLRKIIDKTEYLSDLTKTLLALSEYKNGKSGFVINKTDLSDVLMDVIEDNYSNAVSYGKIIHFSNEQEIGFFVNVDKIAIKQCFANLLENAIKFSDKEIEIKIATHDASYDVIFTNDGKIIPQDDQKDIFNSYFQSRVTSSQAVKGYGIGLSLVKQVIEALDGKISVSSDKKNGTVFTVTLPRAKQVRNR